ncbi:sugar transferase [Arachidicoccus sp.]|uniref:sugar transferase n=1 Tax=Arachidicoccus sp. TaxID=1872624 RepID=UPI003D1DEB54
MYPFFKRLLDLIIAILAFLILLPFMLPIVIILLLTGEHYVFYYQKRVGYKNRLFNIMKFATMLKNSPNIGTGSVTVRNDPRLLPLGKFLRITKINELPQILNVLKGEMSLVGPRPLMSVSFEMYDLSIQKQIYNAKPGITGIGSVIFRDEEALVSETKMDKHEFYRTVIMPYKGALEIWYNQNRSLRVDFWIIFLTAWAIINPKTQLQFKVFKGLPKRNLIQL